MQGKHREKRAKEAVLNNLLPACLAFKQFDKQLHHDHWSHMLSDI